MDTNTKSKLLMLGNTLFLLGLEVTAGQEALTALVEQGYSLCSPEVLMSKKAVDKLEVEFCALEEEYLKQQEILSDLQRGEEDERNSIPWETG